MVTTFPIHLVFKEHDALARIAVSPQPRPDELSIAAGRDERCARAPNCPRAGGGDRIRTDDRLVANQVLYQLSYAPEEWWA